MNDRWCNATKGRHRHTRLYGVNQSLHLVRSPGYPLFESCNFYSESGIFGIHLWSSSFFDRWPGAVSTVASYFFMMDRSVLISGAGIAGPTLAFWLKAAGFAPTLVERASTLRTGGYVIDFWGLGYDIAERMGLAADINRLGYHMREVRIVDDRGARVTGFGTEIFSELTGGRFVTIGRTDLSKLLFERAQSKAEVVFGDEVV